MSRHIEGLRLWLLQRISALYMAGFFVYLLVHFYSHPDPGYQAWHAWLTQPLVSVCFAGFILALLVHGWVGMRDVVLDYVHALGLRLTVLMLIAFVLIGSGFQAIRVLVLAGSG